MESIERHDVEIQKNLERWQRKPLLQTIYRGFYELIRDHLETPPDGVVVELGAGVGNICEVIPGCIRTDLFPNPWIDQTENAYSLSFADASVDSLILFDVFHHLRYPGTALKEWHRVLKEGGGVVVFEPYVSVLGRVIYGLFHDEPIAEKAPIEWFSPPGWDPGDIDYYTAQGNGTRIFMREGFSDRLGDWRCVGVQRLSAISYVMSGGYSAPQLYPSFALPAMHAVDWLCDLVPVLFATRMLAVLEKKT